MKLLAEKCADGNIYGYKFWCPGCSCIHVFRTKVESVNGKSCPSWSFDGNMESPTFTPSLLQYTADDEGHRVTVCHLSVTKGELRFYGDCPHEFRGRNLPMMDIPENWL